MTALPARLAILSCSAVLMVPGAISAQPTTATTADTVRLTEWTVPWEKTTPRDPSLDASGRVWFVGQAGNYVGPTRSENRRLHPH
ncbi:MAG: hypothetical protein IPP90_05980 [Gemmatimonadaceae bacterium]|nr:hypothetical protein [Gemmatimonadaceae bacterium]